MAEALTLAERFWQAFVTRDWAQLDALFASEPEIRISSKPLDGLAAMKSLIDVFVTAFPDLDAKIVDVVEAPDAVAVEVRFTGTHGGPLRMPSGEVPATGRTVDTRSANIFRVANGRIKSWHGFRDNMEMVAQLGLTGSGK